MRTRFRSEVSCGDSFEWGVIERKEGCKEGARFLLGHVRLCRCTGFALHLPGRGTDGILPAVRVRLRFAPSHSRASPYGQEEGNRRFHASMSAGFPLPGRTAHCQRGYYTISSGYVSLRGMCTRRNSVLAPFGRQRLGAGIITAPRLLYHILPSRCTFFCFGCRLLRLILGRTQNYHGFLTE